jgi:hypothetical protein
LSIKDIIEGYETETEEPGGASLPLEQTLEETYRALENKLEEEESSDEINMLSVGMLRHSLDLLDEGYEGIKNDFNTVWNDGKDLVPWGGSTETSEDNWTQKRIDAATRLLGKGGVVTGGAAGLTQGGIRAAAMAGSSALAIPAMAQANAALAEDSEEARKAYERFAGERYYTKQELNHAELPPEEKDRIRSKQGGALGKASYGAEMMMKGLVDTVSNPIKEWDKADSIVDKASLIYDVPATFVLGTIPMAIGATTNFTDAFMTDPLGAVTGLRAAKLGALKTKAAAKGLKEGGVSRALAERKAADIQQRSERLDSGRVISEFLDKAKDNYGEKSAIGPVVSFLSDNIQAAQRGSPLFGWEGKAGAATQLASVPVSMIPGIGYRGAGTRAEELRIMKQMDRRESGNIQKLRAELDELARENPVAFGAVKHVMTDNQKVAPQVFRVINDLETVQKNLLQDMKKVEKQLKKKNIEPEQLQEMQKHQRRLNEFQDRMIDARNRMDPALLDAVRSEAKGIQRIAARKSAKNKALLPQKKLLNEAEWSNAARDAAAHVPRMAKITYDGKVVTPLEFMLKPPRNVDTAKFGLQIMKDIPPKARLVLEQNQSAMVGIMQMMANQGQRLSKLVGPKQSKLLKDQTFLLNTVSGYAPRADVGGYFDLKSTARGEGQLSIAKNHLDNMKKQERQGKLPSIEESLKEIATDREAFEQFNQYANAMERTISAMEYASTVSKALVDSGRVSNVPRKGYVKVGSPKADSRTKGEIQIKSDYEFGELQGKYVPKSVADQLTRYDRYYDSTYGALLALRDLQQGFKTTHTITNIPYFINTAGGLAYTQTLFGGNPMSPFVGAARFAKKDKYYKAMRDAGGIVDSDTLIGLESSRGKSWLYGLADKTMKSEKSAWNALPKAMAELYGRWKTPIDPLYNRRSTGQALGALGTAGLMGTGALGAGVLAGFAATPMALGMGTGFLISKGRQLATLLDQGSRVESFARRMNELASIEAARTGVSKKVVLNKLLKDPEALSNAIDFSLYTNIDYSYVPFGVEHASSVLPQTPFVKFAHRAGEMMIDLPVSRPGALASLSSAHKEYMKNLGEEDKWIYQNAPLNTGGMLVSTGNRDMINMAYMLPFSPSTVADSLFGLKALGALASGVPGLDWMSPDTMAYPHSAAVLARTAQQPEPLVGPSGYLSGLYQATQGKDRFGYDLPDGGPLARARAFINTYSPSSIYYLGQIEEASSSPNGKDRYGYTPEQIFFNSIGMKITPGSVTERKLRRATKAFSGRIKKITRDEARIRRKYVNNPEKGKSELENLAKKKQRLRELYSSAVNGDTISALNKISGYEK